MTETDNQLLDDIFENAKENPFHKSGLHLRLKSTIENTILLRKSKFEIPQDVTSL